MKRKGEVLFYVQRLVVHVSFNSFLWKEHRLIMTKAGFLEEPCYLPTFWHRELYISLNSCGYLALPQSLVLTYFTWTHLWCQIKLIYIIWPMLMERPILLLWWITFTDNYIPLQTSLSLSLSISPPTLRTSVINPCSCERGSWIHWIHIENATNKMRWEI